MGPRAIEDMAAADPVTKVLHAGYDSIASIGSSASSSSIDLSIAAPVMDPVSRALNAGYDSIASLGNSSGTGLSDTKGTSDGVGKLFSDGCKAASTAAASAAAWYWSN